MMKCNFCKSELKSLSSLNNHKKTNKKCIEVQRQLSKDEVKPSLVSCIYCNKKFTNIHSHNLSCKIKKNKENEQRDIEKKSLELFCEQLKIEKETIETSFEKLKIEKDKLESDYKKTNRKKKKLELDNKKQLKEINELKELVIKLQTSSDIYSDIYKEDQEAIISIAKQPKTSYKNTNNYNLGVLNVPLMTENVSVALQNATLQELCDGQKSVGRVIAPCLKDEEGKNMYECTDRSRGNFISKDKDGNITRDLSGKALANIVRPIAANKMEEIIKKDAVKKWKPRRILTLRKDIEGLEIEIDNLKNHILGFPKDSEKWKCVNDKLSDKKKLLIEYWDEYENLQNDSYVIGEENIAYNDCDEKLMESLDDINNMTKDCSKFSKTVSEFI